MSEQQQQQQQQSENEEGYVDWGKRFFNESWEAVKKKVHWMDTEEGAEMQHEEATSDDEDEEDGASKPAPPSLLKKGDEKHAPPGETTKRVSIARSIGRGLRNSIRGKRASQVSTPGPGMNAISEDEEAKLSEVEEEEEHDDEGEDDQAKDTEEDDDADSEEAKDTEEEEDEEQEAEDEEAEAEAEVEDAEAEAADEEEDEDEDEEAAAEEAEGGDVLGELGAAAASAAAVRAASQRSSSRRVSALRSSAKRMSISRSSMRSGGSKATNASAGSRESAKRNSLKQITKRISWRSKANKAEPAGGAFRRFSRSNRSSGVPEAKQARLEDSNIAGIGSAEDRAARLAAAESDKNLAGAGKNFGLEIWRVENKRTKNDTPDFGVRRWPKEEYGNFYSGDSYVILNTYGKKDKLTGKPTDAKDYDVHFWLGSESSQDEIGTAAIKTVELSALLDDKPVHHRERQGHESKLFLSYFKELVYLKGGHDSGFRKVKPKNYEPRLLMIRHTSRVTKAYSIPVDARCMNHGDAFVLDTGLVVYRWVGEDANVFEMNRSGLLQANICSSRYGKARKEDANDQFWKVLGGSIDDVRPASDPYEIDTHDDERLKADDIKLWRISDASGKLEFEMEAEGKVPYRLLDPDDVFLIHANIGLWIWLGDRATQYERSSGMRVADEYIRQLKLPNTMTVTSITQQQADTNTLFRALFAGRRPSRPWARDVSPATMAALREARDECAFTAALETAWRRDATGARWTAPEALEKTRKAKRRRRARLAERQLRSKKRRGSADAVAHGDDDDDAPAETFIQIRPFDAAKTSVAAGSESAQPLVLGTRAVLRALEDPAPKLAAVVVCAKQEAVDIEIRQRVLDACAARQIPAFALVETTPQLLGKAMRLRSVMTLAFAQRSALGADMRQALDILGA